MDYRYKQLNLTSAKFSIEPTELRLKQTWTISRASDDYKTNYILKLKIKECLFFSEIAPNLRYGESHEHIETHYSELILKKKISLNDLDEENWGQSFKCAVSNLILKALTFQSGDSLSQLFNSKPFKKIQTSYSIPIMSVDNIDDYLKINDGFDVYKLKIRGGEDLLLLKEVLKFTDGRIRIDANEGFESLEEYLEFEKHLPLDRIEFVEQPFKAVNVDFYRKLKPISRFQIIADESLTNLFDGQALKDQFHGVNIKQMKAGGLYNSFELIMLAKKLGLKVMLGCMIESGLGIYEALHLAHLCDYCDLDGSLLLSNDPFESLFKHERGYLSYES